MGHRMKMSSSFMSLLHQDHRGVKRKEAEDQKKEKQETLSQLFLVNSRSDVQVDPRLLTRVCSKLTDKGELLIQILTQVRDKRLRILLPVN